MRKMMVLLSVALLFGARGSQAADCGHAVGAPNDPAGQFALCYGINQSGPAMLAPQAWVQHCYQRNHCDALFSVYVPQTGAQVNSFPTISMESIPLPIPNSCGPDGCTPHYIPFPGLFATMDVNTASASVLGIPINLFTYAGFSGLCVSSVGSCGGSGISNYVKPSH